MGSSHFVSRVTESVPDRKERSVILLTSPGLAQRLLASAFARRLPLVGIVVERPQATPDDPGSPQRAKQMVRRILGNPAYDRLAAVRQYLKKSSAERRVERIESSLMSKAAAELSTLAEDRKGWPDGIQVLEAPQINDERVVAWCGERHPALLLVYGTSILRAPLIRVPSHGVLNAHASILPHFRGVFSEFWQVLQKRLDTAGVTIHFVDEGVDTGDIVLQVRTPSETGIDPYSLRSRNVATALTAYPEAAAAILGGIAERRKQKPAEGPAYRSRDRTFDKRVQMLRGLGYEV